MRFLFTVPDIHLCHVISYLVKAIDIHLCHMFLLRLQTYTCAMFFLYFVKAIDIHLCHVFLRRQTYTCAMFFVVFSTGYRHTPMPNVLFLWLQTFTCAMFFLLRTSTRAIFSFFFKQNDSIGVLPPALRFSRNCDASPPPLSLLTSA
jgi:hypothetical protein